MKLQINKSKVRMVGVRLSEESLKEITKLAKKENVAQTEIIRSLIDAALKEISKPLTK